jgi:hypothetical protein
LWHYISEYGLLNNSLEINFIQSFKLSDYSQNIDKKVNYGEEIPKIVNYPAENGNNIIANGVKIYEISTFYPA